MNNRNFYGNISSENIFVLETLFAVLTENGWVIPNWLIYLKDSINEQSNSV